MLKPIFDRLLVSPIKSNKTATGIELPEKNTGLARAKVIEVGEQVKTINKDSIVYYESFASAKVTFENISYELVKETDIICVEA